MIQPNSRAENCPTASQIAEAKAFVQHLGTGKEKAKTAAQIAAEMQIEPRQVQKYAETARRIGFPVIASCEESQKGLYLAENEDDVRDYSNRLHHRAGEIHKTRRELLRNLKNWNFSERKYIEKTEGKKYE